MAGYHPAKIVARQLVSPTVIVLDLEVKSSTFKFQSGQWLDFMVPPFEWVGGFSPASLPRDLPKISIAVKRSNHPPSQWVHSDESKAIGRDVKVQVGGSCILDAKNLDTQPVVFCAGGVGISPLLSMYRQWTQLQQENLIRRTDTSPKAYFLYSVSSEEELVFKDELMQLGANTDARNRHEIIVTLTRQSTWNRQAKCRLESQGVQCRTGRYLKEFLLGANVNSAFYICGPPSMLDEGVILLQKRGVSRENLHFKRWW